MHLQSIFSIRRRSGVILRRREGGMMMMEEIAKLLLEGKTLEEVAFSLSLSVEWLEVVTGTDGFKCVREALEDGRGGRIGGQGHSALFEAGEHGGGREGAWGAAHGVASAE